ncbi:MAG: 2-C-methyl-D-erythritol 4-phosphate cytidylyltransferase [Bacteroidales bacterium]|nr:2-C-methyl-D-erythritol 4-phosphate cytidylyltransferase [Bacteroidales bacterium]
MERKKYLIAMAGGSGTRMKAGMPKQFLELDGKPILQRTLENFIEAIPGLNIITVLPKDHIETWKNLCGKTDFLYPQRLVEGGITRFHSVRNALEHVPDGATVAIQDGVRPLGSLGLIRRLFDEAEGCDALIPVTPTIDTLKAVRTETGADGKLRLVATGCPDPDRSQIWGAQTPQMFRSEKIKAAYSQPYETDFTDDASVAARFGIPVSYSEGERFNIKITTPEDLEIARFIISSRR